MTSVDDFAVKDLMDAVTKQAVSFLKNEAEIDILSIDYELDGLKSTCLRDLTTLITVICKKNAYVAFSFDDSFIEAVFQEYCDELDITEEEKSEYIDETAADLINIVLGNATPYIENNGEVIHLTPPMMISEAKSFSGKKNLAFYVNTLKSAHGKMTILCATTKD